MLASLLLGCAVAASPTADWTITAERTGFKETGRYQEAVDFVRRIEKSSPYVQVRTLGTSPEGREIVAVFASKERNYEPASFQRADKPFVLVINGIHPGECDGKDASLMLLRDMTVANKHPELLEQANWIIIPVFGVDGHERFGPNHRVNQNGPREMGWRATAENLNLNRDFVKADGGEMRALLGLLRRYRPDFVFDTHTTNGSDHRFTLMLGVPNAPTLAPGLGAFQRNLYEAVKAKTDADGWPTSPYFDMVSAADPGRGISIQDFSPRFSIGYFTALDRPSMLVETHVLKPYEDRVRATYSVIRRTVEHLSARAGELKRELRSADRANEQIQPGADVVLSARTTDATRPFRFLGFEPAPYKSEITGSEVLTWSKTPRDWDTTIRDQFAANVTVKAPTEYVIPAPWREAIERLELHGIPFTRLRQPETATFDSYRFENVSWPRGPFEGRFSPTYRVVPVRERRTLPAGSAVVRVAGAHAKLVMHLLEPEGPDSLVRWGFFNAIFERKEYAEAYAMEPIARKMLDADPELRKEFEERLKDPAFAGSPSARLDWFYERSPFWDVRYLKYPVVRR